MHHHHARISLVQQIGWGARVDPRRLHAMTPPEERQAALLALDLNPVGESGSSREVGRGAPGGPPERNAILREAAERLSAALFHVVHQPTSKGRDRSLAALVALIYGPTPFGGVNNLRDVAMRYGMTEQNLFQLMRTHRDLLARTADPEYEI
jgi:hypothetical protein